MKKALLIIIGCLVLGLAGCAPSVSPEAPGAGEDGGSYQTVEKIKFLKGLLRRG